MTSSEPAPKSATPSATRAFGLPVRRRSALWVVLACIVFAGLWFALRGGEDSDGEDGNKAAAVATPEAELPTPTSLSPLTTPRASAMASAQLREAQLPFPSDVELVGISHGLSGRGAAFLAMGSGPQKRLPVGRALSGGWVLEDVEGGAALFRTAAGHPHRLHLDQHPEANAPRPGGTTAPDRRDLGNEANGAPGDMLFTALTLAGEATDAGFRLNTVPPALQGSGLRAGDTILSLDDDDFDTSERRHDLARAVAEGRRAELRVERGGRKISLTIGG